MPSAESEGWEIHYRELAGQWWCQVTHLQFLDRDSALRAAKRYFLGRRYGYRFIVAVRVVPTDWEWDSEQRILRSLRYFPGDEDLLWPGD